MKKINRVPVVLIIFAFVFSWQIQCFEYPSGLHTNDLRLLCLWWFVYSVGLRSKPCAATHSHNKCSVPPTQTGPWYACIICDGQNLAMWCPLFFIKQAYAPLHKHRTQPMKGHSFQQNDCWEAQQFTTFVYICVRVGCSTKQNDVVKEGERRDGMSWNKGRSRMRWTMGILESELGSKSEIQLPYLLAVWPWSNYLASLSFNTPIHKTGVITSFTQD